MKKVALWTLPLVLVAAAVVFPLQAASPIKVGPVAPIEDLVAEADEKAKALEEALKTSDSYNQGKKKSIPQDAVILAILAQAIAEHDGAAAWKEGAPEVRAAAGALAKAASYDEAKKALDGVKSGMSGKKGSAPADVKWVELSNLDAVMSEVNKRNGVLRRATKKVPDDPTDAARDASVLAVLAIVTHEDTHEVKNKADIGKWQQMCKDMQTHMTAVAAGLKKKDGAAASDAFKKAGQTCSDCHKVFREDG